METLDGIINDWCSDKAVDEVAALMENHGVPAGKLYRAPEMLADPHFALFVAYRVWSRLSSRLSSLNEKSRLAGCWLTGGGMR